MNLIKDSWNNSDYNNFIKYLFEIRDVKYGEFHSNLGIGSSVIGIRTPILKSIAKEISKGNYREFLNKLSNDYYEEITLYGFIVCDIDDIEESTKYIDIFKNKINNWASCDLFCSSYKIVKKNKEYFWKYINDNISENNLWVRRMCFVLILSYYVDEKYLKEIFKLCDSYCCSDYYVKMAVAWLRSVSYIKNPETATKYIRNNKLDNFTHNKAISKIRDSYRVGSDDKNYLNSLKRR